LFSKWILSLHICNIIWLMYVDFETETSSHCHINVTFSPYYRIFPTPTQCVQWFKHTKYLRGVPTFWKKKYAHNGGWGQCSIEVHTIEVWLYQCARRGVKSCLGLTFFSANFNSKLRCSRFSTLFTKIWKPGDVVSFQ
jgi:hypothetical protein